MHPATASTFALYLLAMLVIGWLAWRRTHGLGDYILGGRRLHPAAAALSAGASDMSGWLLLGLPGALFTSGLSASWIAVGLTIGAWCNWRFVSARLRTETTRGSDSLTLPAWFGRRFTEHSNAIRIISTLIILLFFTFYTASGLVAGAKLFSSTLNLSYSHALFLGAAAVVAYTAVGGFLAVSWTDVCQGLLMLVALVMLPVLLFADLGGPGNLHRGLAGIDPSLVSWSGGLGVAAWLSSLAWGLGYFGQPHILARFMALRDPADAPAARRIGMSWMIVSMTGALLIGLFGRFWYEGQIDVMAADFNAETIFIVLAQAFFHPWVAGLVLAAILAAVMSTVDSQLLVASSALTEDVCRPLTPYLNDNRLVWIGRGAVILVAVIAIGIASDPQNLVLDLVSYAWAGLGAGFGPVVLLALYWRRFNGNGAIAAMLTGAILVVFWPMLETAVYELLIAFPAAALAGVLASTPWVSQTSR